MALFVPQQLILPTERQMAIVATERFLSRMNDGMPRQIPLRNERLRTLRTHKRLPARMNPHVFREIRVPRKRFEADVTRERFHARMHDCVFAQIRTSSKRAMALRTIVRFLVLVDTLQMRRILQTIRKTHLAIVTLVRHRMIVSVTLVRTTLTLVRKRLITVPTHGHVFALVQFTQRLVIIVAVVVLVCVRLKIGFVVQCGGIDHHDDVGFDGGGAGLVMRFRGRHDDGGGFRWFEG